MIVKRLFTDIIFSIIIAQERGLTSIYVARGKIPYLLNLLFLEIR